MNYYSTSLAASPCLARLANTKSKKVKFPKRKSVAAAADFMSQVIELGILDDVLAKGAASVGHPTPCIPPMSPYSASPKAPIASQKPAYPLWWREYRKRHPPLFAKARHPVSWENAHPILKLEFAYWAMTLMGEVHAFTLNLRHDIEAVAKSQRKPCEWIAKRINRRLTEALGRKVPIVMCGEEAQPEGPRRLHFHGYALIGHNDLELVKSALKMAGGVWMVQNQRQIAFNEAPDHGWLSYAVKALDRADPRVRVSLRPAYWPTDFTDAPVYKSDELGKLSRKLFTACRWALLKRRSVP
ncbi:MAG: hypothetical protein JSR72_15050 [Proteobacteria bacterium]|nr:hypothetical protein [Pseudomonadota bacterium]